MSTTSISILRRVCGIGSATIDAFREADYQTLGDLEGITEDALTAVPGVGAATVRAVLEFLGSLAADELVRVYRPGDKLKNIPSAGIAAHRRETRRFASSLPLRPARSAGTAFR